ncbi:hypothetical protein ACIQK9_10325 [Streptomyces hydrogenans]|uniref:hypothetical protein n=1 Tax=Streptomyces hydrogenans TaxID=1873719 RepID=UPI00380877BB
MPDANTTAAACDRLVELVVPPADPVDAHGDWTAAEMTIGSRLPGDYRRLVETYGWDASHPHQLRIGFPPEDSEQVRQRLFAATQFMGCEVLQITTAAGRRLPTWDAVIDEDE